MVLIPPCAASVPMSRRHGMIPDVRHIAISFRAMAAGSDRLEHNVIAPEDGASRPLIAWRLTACRFSAGLANT
jgi:hypothetical protein